MLAGILKVAAGSLSVRFVSAGAMLIAIRYLPAADYAQATVLIAAGSVGYAVVGPALNRIFMVESKNLGLEARGEFLALQMAGALVVAAPMLIWGMFEASALLALGFAGARLLGDFPKNVSLRSQKFSAAALSDLLRNALALVLIAAIIVVPQWRNAIFLVGAYIVADMAAFFAFAARAPFSPQFTAQTWRLAKRLIQPPLCYVFFYTAILALYGQAEIFILDHFAQDEVVASFGAAMRYYGLVVAVLTSMNSVYLSATARLSGIEEFAAILSKHYKILAVLIPGLIVMAATAQWWIPLLDGGRYPGSIPVFQILAASAALSFVFNPHVNVLMKLGDYRWIFLCIVFSSLASLGPRLWLVAEFEAVGAAWGVLLAFLLLNGGFFVRAQTLRKRG